MERDLWQKAFEWVKVNDTALYQRLAHIQLLEIRGCGQYGLALLACKTQDEADAIGKDNGIKMFLSRLTRLMRLDIWTGVIKGDYSDIEQLPILQNALTQVDGRIFELEV